MCYDLTSADSLRKLAQLHIRRRHQHNVNLAGYLISIDLRCNVWTWTISWKKLPHTLDSAISDQVFFFFNYLPIIVCSNTHETLAQFSCTFHSGCTGNITSWSFQHPLAFIRAKDALESSDYSVSLQWVISRFLTSLIGKLGTGNFCVPIFRGDKHVNTGVNKVMLKLVVFP